MGFLKGSGFLRNECDQALHKIHSSSLGVNRCEIWFSERVFFFGAFQDPWKLRFAAFVWVAWMIGFSLLNRQELTMRNRGLLAYIYYHICFYIWNINSTVFLHNFQEIPPKNQVAMGDGTSGCPLWGLIQEFYAKRAEKKHLFHPIGSMYGIFTYIYHRNQPNVGEYTSPMDGMGMLHPGKFSGWNPIMEVDGSDEFRWINWVIFRVPAIKFQDVLCSLNVGNEHHNYH